MMNLKEAGEARGAMLCGTKSPRPPFPKGESYREPLSHPVGKEKLLFPTQLEEKLLFPTQLEEKLLFPTQLEEKLLFPTQLEEETPLVHPVCKENSSCSPFSKGGRGDLRSDFQKNQGMPLWGMP
jgi:hypothetical protein